MTNHRLSGKEKKKNRVIRLSDARSACRLLGRLAIQLQRGEADLSSGRLLVAVVDSWLDTLRAEGFEKRLTNLEERINGNTGGTV